MTSASGDEDANEEPSSIPENGASDGTEEGETKTDPMGPHRERELRRGFRRVARRNGLHEHRRMCCGTRSAGWRQARSTNIRPISSRIPARREYMRACSDEMSSHDGSGERPAKRRSAFVDVSHGRRGRQKDQ